MPLVENLKVLPRYSTILNTSSVQLKGLFSNWNIVRIANREDPDHIASSEAF